MKFKKEENLIKIDISLIIIGILILIAIHLLRDDGNFIKNSLSNYAASSEYGSFVSFVFYIFALINTTIGILFFTFKNIRVKLGSILFFFSSLFIILLTVFHTDGNGIIESYGEYIHIISAGLLFLTYPIIMFLFGSQFNTKVLRYYSCMSFTIISFLAIFGVIFAARNLHTGLLETTFLGLFEKLAVFVIVVWMIILLVSHNKLKESNLST